MDPKPHSQGTPAGEGVAGRPAPPSSDPLVRRLRLRLWWERGLFSLALLALASAWLHSVLFPSVWAVYVDGRPAVALPDEARARQVLDRVKSAYAGRLEEIEAPPTFKERVEVRSEEADQDLWADADTAAALLRGEVGDEETRHEVVEGETAAAI